MFILSGTVSGRSLIDVLYRERKVRVSARKEISFEFTAIPEYSVALNVFNITNAVTSKDKNALINALKEIKSFDAEPLGVVTLLYQGFKKLILVWLASNPTPDTTGLKSNVIYAINKSPRVFNKNQLLNIYQFLNSIDKKLKTGNLCDISHLIDYVICKIFTF